MGEGTNAQTRQSRLWCTVAEDISSGLLQCSLVICYTALRTILPESTPWAERPAAEFAAWAVLVKKSALVKAALTFPTRLQGFQGSGGSPPLKFEDILSLTYKISGAALRSPSLLGFRKKSCPC